METMLEAIEVAVVRLPPGPQRISAACGVDTSEDDAEVLRALLIR
jgi:hypothetical protein